MSKKNVEMEHQRVALSIAVVVLGIACFIIGTVAVALPQWGTFRNRYTQERGNYGPWQMCKDINFGRQLCGQNISSFKPNFAVYVAGICGAIGIVALGIYCLVSFLLIAMQVTKSKIFCRYSYTVLLKVIVSVISALFTLTAVCLFATQRNDLEKGYVVEVAFCFYMEVVLTIVSLVLMFLTISEYYLIRRTEVDHLVTMSGTTIGNPGFRDPASSASSTQQTNGISMTRTSAQFLPPSNTRASRNFPKLSFTTTTNNNHVNLTNGGVSMSPGSLNGSTISGFSTASTTSTVLSNNPRGMPLRSSLKKPKTSNASSTTDNSFGISNPGFSGTSPTFTRSASVKKVRITTHTTDV